MKNTLLDLQKQRRSIYVLGRNVSQSQAEITDFIENTIKETPSPFNNQTTRAVITYGKSHEKVWDIVLAALRDKISDDDAFAQTKQKIDMFKAAYGTILWFTDTSIVKKFEDQFPSYADNFGDWSEQAQGNAQFAVWTGLSENGIGVNLQHYNPLIDAEIAKAFDIPSDWRLRAEMDFGSIEAPAGDKDYLPNEDRFKVFD